MSLSSINLNPVTVSVTVAKQKVNPVNLILTQEYGEHHHFEIVLDYDMYGDDFMNNPLKHIELIGRLVYIRFNNKVSLYGEYLFKGVVTSVRQTGKEGKKGYLVISGSSPTIMLEKGKRMDIYSNRSLYQITSKIAERAYTDYIKFGSEPVFKNKIDFLMQYNESDWDFMKRLAYLYRENLFYSGHELLFGYYPDLKTVNLTYDREITDLEFCSKMTPNNFERYQYVPENDSIIEKESPEKIDNSNDYLDKAEEMSHYAMTLQDKSKSYVDTPIYTNSEIAEMLKRDKARNAAESITIKGRSKTYKTSIGQVINISMPDILSETSNIGTYRVIKSVHSIDESGRYSCEFEAVPATIEVMPIAEPKLLTADSIVAVVKSNEDPLNQGRVQVEFNFSSNYNYAWVRVLTPNAGSSEEVSHNRGMVFIPEKGDQVMVGFEQGDPNRPYVMGSFFHGKNGKGGRQNNAEKSIITKSGIQIVFNDNQRSLHIQDPSGNTWDMDGQGNINVFAPKKIKMESEEIDILATKNFNINVAQNMRTLVYGQTYLETPLLKQNITDYFHTFGGQVLINSHNDIRIESPETYLVGERKLFAHSAECAIVNSGGTTQITGVNGTNHTNIAAEYESVKEKIEPKCMVSFRPHSGYDAEFGFDWFRMGDSGLSEDNPFKDIIGKLYEEDGETVLINTNSYKGIFKQDQQMYEKALRDYKNMVVDWKSTLNDVYLYSPPYLSLLEGNTAKLKLVLEVEEVPTDAITFEFEDKMGSDYFSLNVSKIKKASLKKGNYALDAYLMITALKECNKQQVLLAKTDGKVCGKLFIHANSKEYHKPIKIVFIEVETDINPKDPGKGEPIEGGYDFFKDCLHQAFVIPQDVCELADLNCKSKPEESQFELRDTFCSKTDWGDYYLHDNRNTWGWELKEYLERVTVEQHGNRYDSYYRVYFLGEYLPKIGGFAFFDTQFGVYFKQHMQSYIAHELFHAMGLPHTFDGRNKNALYTYKGVSTDNILDYTHLIGTKTKTIFGWQMRLLNPKIGLLNLTENSDTKDVEYEEQNKNNEV